jgi:hypothetical protein
MSSRIKELNIQFWREPYKNGRLMMTAGVAARGTHFHLKCIHALRVYDSWNPDHDPRDEADMCVLDIDGEKVWAKIDCYDKHDQNFGSEDPADPAKTLRVGTLLFPEEY